MKGEQRRVAIELRESPDRLSPGIIHGRLVTFGEWADIGGLFRERVAAGAMRAASRVVANVQHVRSRPLAATGPNGGLVLTTSDAGIDAAIRLPDTQDGRDAATLCREGVLTGLSLEMAVSDDQWAGIDRTIRAATFDRIGLVDTPAYPGSVLEELRAFHADVAYVRTRRFFV